MLDGWMDGWMVLGMRNNKARNNLIITKIHTMVHCGWHSPEAQISNHILLELKISHTTSKHSLGGAYNAADRHMFGGML